MKDEWKDIIGFDGYQISDNGRVRSPRQILKQQVNHNGYCVVRLSRWRNYKRSFYVHQLQHLLFGLGINNEMEV